MISIYILYNNEFKTRPDKQYVNKEITENENKIRKYHFSGKITP